jgi:hypothetical protein
LEIPGNGEYINILNKKIIEENEWVLEADPEIVE